MFKLKFLRSKTFDQEIHRAGWNWVMSHLYKNYHSENAEVWFDDFIEKTFDWDYKDNKGKTLPHHIHPWIGVIHNPLTVKKPFDIKASSLNICSRIPFLKALENCKGIYVLSKDLKESIDYIFGFFGIDHVPVEVLYHPTILDVPQFSLDDFNDNKRIINIGYWLRDFSPLFLLDTEIPKYILLGKLQYAKDNYKLQNAYFNKMSKVTGCQKLGSTRTLQHLSNEEYDAVLKSSIGFLNLIDTSANNAVIECMARNIPLLVNYHPAVVEYLGNDYPFYYVSQLEANEKINNDGLIKETHEYLKDFDKKIISIENFLYSFEMSDIFNNI